MSVPYLTATRLHLAIAAAFGLCGVAALAAGAHASGPSMTVAGQMLLFHAPAVMAAALARKAGFLHGRAAQLAIALLILGVALFAADLTMRAALGTSLFAMAAPLGGLLAMAGWLGLGFAALLAQRDPR